MNKYPEGNKVAQWSGVFCTTILTTSPRRWWSAKVLIFVNGMLISNYSLLAWATHKRSSRGFRELQYAVVIIVKRAYKSWHFVLKTFWSGFLIWTNTGWKTGYREAFSEFCEDVRIDKNAQSAVSIFSRLLYWRWLIVVQKGKKPREEGRDIQKPKIYLKLRSQQR